MPPVASNSRFARRACAATTSSARTPTARRPSSRCVTSDFAVPGLAVGRLVETPTEIAGIIDAYVAANGVVVAARRSLVTGYDFLEDAANAVRDRARGSAPAPRRHADHAERQVARRTRASWTADAASQQLLGSRHDVIFLAGHFSANSALAADFATSLLTTDLAASTVDLDQRAGLQRGLPRRLQPRRRATRSRRDACTLDWAQAFAAQARDADRRHRLPVRRHRLPRVQRAAVSQLRARAARGHRAGRRSARRWCRRSTTTWRRRRTCAAFTRRRCSRRRCSACRCSRVNMPAGRGAVRRHRAGDHADRGRARARLRTLGLRRTTSAVAPALTPQTLPLTNFDRRRRTSIATWLSGPDGVVTKPGEPALPLATRQRDADRPDGRPARRRLPRRHVRRLGAAAAVHRRADDRASRRARRRSSRRCSIPGACGRRTTSARSPATAARSCSSRRRSTASPDFAAGTSTQRKFHGARPAAVLQRQPDQGGALRSAGHRRRRRGKERQRRRVHREVVGDPAAAIHQVWVTYTSDAVRHGRRSISCNASPRCPRSAARRRTRGSGRDRLVNAPAGLKYIVQAVSGIGLVALDDNRGAYYGIGVAAPSATALALVSPPASAVIGDSGVVNVRLLSGGAPVANRLVLIALGGVAQLGSTASDGTVSVKLPVGAIPGPY